jgi:glycerol kinase
MTMLRPRIESGDHKRVFLLRGMTADEHAEFARLASELGVGLNNLLLAFCRSARDLRVERRKVDEQSIHGILGFYERCKEVLG